MAKLMDVEVRCFGHQDEKEESLIAKGYQSDKLTQFMTELIQTKVREYFRPNLWPNTPDILPQYLQYSGRPGFIVRFALAATLGASYGIYGPAFELIDSQPLDIGKE